MQAVDENPLVCIALLVELYLVQYPNDDQPRILYYQDKDFEKTGKEIHRVLKQDDRAEFH